MVCNKYAYGENTDHYMYVDSHLPNIGLMRNLWLASPKQRLEHWRQLRLCLTEQKTQHELSDICNYVGQWWSHAPLTKLSLDPFDSALWPTVWELLDDGHFCQYNLALGMAYTLFWIDPSWTVKIMRINDDYNEDHRMIVVVNDEYVLNHRLGKIAYWPEVQSLIHIEQIWDISHIVEQKE